jgi:hypothetical protein
MRKKELAPFAFASRSRVKPSHAIARYRTVNSSAAKGIPEPSSRYLPLLKSWVVTSKAIERCRKPTLRLNPYKKR